ncbi:MAG TPA: hypothetical protein PK129_15505 [Cellvibrionaceae bacterium]|nr:hypothetical protein [Cellvibrionaceae bacterium]
MKSAVISSWVLVVGLVSGNAMAAQTLTEAKKVVADYQTLREACSDATGAKRLECMARLSSTSDSYREAKTFVMANSTGNQIKIAKAH